MSDDNDRTLSNLGVLLINKIIHPITILGAPAFLMLLVAIFVFDAFTRGLYTGLRSLAGALLPLIIATAIITFKRDLFGRLGDINVWISFCIATIWGFLLMFIINLLSSSLIGFPIRELILSSSFSILVFSYIDIPRNTTFSYYYGAVTGFLLYIVTKGFPL